MKFNNFDAVKSGKQTCTARTPPGKWNKWYAKKVGKIIDAEGKDPNDKFPILITEVGKITVGRVKKNYHREQGFDTPEEFEEYWEEYHGYLNPRKLVCVIWFRIPTKNELKKRKRVRKRVIIPSSNTKPELKFKKDVLPVVLKHFKIPESRYVANHPYKTRFRYYALNPDVRLLDIPLIIEVDGKKWHSSNKAVLKDRAKEECYMGDGYYVFRVLAKSVMKETETVISILTQFIQEIQDEQHKHPRVRHYPE